jgi:heme-degrading monooxygenase HmoA
MIARIWRGVTLAEKADDYLEHLRETGLKDFAHTPGNRGVYVLRRVQGEHCEFQIVSMWDSMEAVRRFAGMEAERSRYYDEDEQYLLEMEPLVRHYEVAEAIADPGA